MATKIQRARRIGGIAIGAVKAIFRTGKAWGTARTRVAPDRRTRPTAPSRAALAVGAIGGAAGAYFLDPQNGKRRRHVAFDRAKAIVRRGAAEGEAAGPGGGEEPLRDPDLAKPTKETVAAAP
jgi:hypothetical protein